MKPKKEYKYGLIWIAKDNPLGLKQGYYSQEQINKVLDKKLNDKHFEKVVAFYKFMKK